MRRSSVRRNGRRHIEDSIEAVVGRIIRYPEGSVAVSAAVWPRFTTAPRASRTTGAGIVVRDAGSRLDPLAGWSARRFSVCGCFGRTRSSRRRTASGIAELEARRRKLLDLYYRDKISCGLFADEDGRINRAIEALRSEEAGERDATGLRTDLAERFEEVGRILRDMEVERIWSEATEQERRVLVEELVDRLAIFPDHLEVTIAGAPRLNVLLSEVGLREKVQNVGVGGGI